VFARSTLIVLDQPELGTIGGPIRRQVCAQRGPSVRDGLGVRVEIALGGDQRSVPGNLPEHMDRDTGIGHPSKAGVAEVVTTQMLVAELGDDLVPVGRIPQHRRGDPAAAWTREDACRGVMADRVQSSLNERADFLNERDSAGPLAFRSLVDEPAGAWCGLPPNCPGPGVAVNVGAPDAGYFADPGCGAGGEDDDVTQPSKWSADRATNAAAKS
jgi:hypothetical protein